MNKRARTSYRSAPVAISAQVHQTNGQQGIWLKGREFIMDVNNAAGYVNTAAVLRPTDYSVFSWLASIARKFNNYKFRDVRLTYEPTCASTQVGSVGLYFDPDPSNTGPATWSAFVNTGANTHGAPWVRHTLQVPIRDFAARKEYYTKDEYPDLNAPSAPIIDPLEHYPGIYGVVTDNAAGAVGKLYLEYSISLWKSMSDSPPVTSLAGVALNPSIALNSGCGMIVKNTTGSGGIGVHHILGAGITGVTKTTLQPWAGFGYFEKSKVNNVLTVIQNVQLICTVGVSVVGGTAALPVFYVGQTNVTGDVTVVRKLWDSGAGTASMAAVYTLKLTKGWTFAITCQSGVAEIAADTITLSPFVRELDQ